MDWESRSHKVLQEIAVLHTKMHAPEWSLFKFTMLDWTMWAFPVLFYGICLNNMIKHENIFALGCVGVILLGVILFSYCRLLIYNKKNALSTAAWIKVVERQLVEEFRQNEIYRQTIASLPSSINQRNLMMQRLVERDQLLKTKLEANMLSFSKLHGEIDG